MRFFVTDSAQFGFSGPVGAQAAFVTAHIYVDGSLEAIVGLGSGISEVESPPGTWTYHIVDKELSFVSPPSPGVVSIQWFAQNGSSVNADTYPTITAPTLDTVADPTALNVSSTTPTANATGVSTRNPFIIVFDDDLDTANLDLDQIVLRKVGTNLRIPFTGYIDSADTTRLIIKPRSDLSETTLYELLIANEAVYSAGANRMGSDFTLRFTTGADDFTSITEATTEGVVERAGPIVLSGTSILTTTPGAIMSSAVPAAGSYNFCGDQLLVYFSEVLDAGSLPTVTITIESVFGLKEYYYVNGSLWNSTTAPTFPSVSGVIVGTTDITINLDGNLPGNAIVTVTLSGVIVDATSEVLPDVSYSFTTCLFPVCVGVSEVRRVARDYISSDITDEVIAQAIAQAGLDLYLRVGNKAKVQQRCVIKNQVALELLDDWLYENGGGLGESKTLGAFSVRRGLSGGVKPPTYARIEEQLEKCWYELSSYFNAATATVKSISSPFERKDYRIRTWRESMRSGTPSEMENGRADRIDKLPGVYDEWS